MIISGMHFEPLTATATAMATATGTATEVEVEDEPVQKSAHNLAKPVELQQEVAAT